MYLVKEEEVTEKQEEISNEIEYNLDFLLEKIQQLPDRYRLVFNLYVLDNFSHKEISEMLQISEGTSKSNLSRARKLLKQELENKPQEHYLNER